MISTSHDVPCIGSGGARAALALVVLGLAGLALPARAAAQDGGPGEDVERSEPRRVDRLADRQELRARMDSLHAVWDELADGRAGPSGSGVARGRADTEELRSVARRLARIEHRLQTGDFQPGDMVELRVAEVDDWSGRFTVGHDRTLKLPRIDPIPLTGLLYPEAEAKVEDVLSEYVRDPDVRLEPLKRIAVLGAVESPGFYHVPAGATISDALMAAGGPSQDSKLDELRLRRSGKVVEVDPDFAFSGHTLEQLDLGSGDALQVPKESGNSLRTVAFALGSVASVVGTMMAIF